MATLKKATKVVVKHHKVWLIPLILVVVGLGVGLYFLNTRSEPKVSVQNLTQLQSYEAHSALPKSIDKTTKPKITVAQYNQTVQQLIGVVTPTVSFLSILGGFILLVFNIIKTIKGIKSSTK